jgi:hypothetical protein
MTCKRHKWAHNGTPYWRTIHRPGGSSSGREREYWPMRCIVCETTAYRPGDRTRAIRLLTSFELCILAAIRGARPIPVEAPGEDGSKSPANRDGSNATGPEPSSPPGIANEDLA